MMKGIPVMSGALKQSWACLLGVALALLIAGSATAQDATKQVTAATPSPPVCPGSQGGSLSFTPVTSTVAFTCSALGGTDISLATAISLTSTATAAMPETLNCPTTFTMKIVVAPTLK